VQYLCTLGVKIVCELLSIISSLIGKERDRTTFRHPELYLPIGRVYNQTLKHYKFEKDLRTKTSLHFGVVLHEGCRNDVKETKWGETTPVHMQTSWKHFVLWLCQQALPSVQATVMCTHTASVLIPVSTGEGSEDFSRGQLRSMRISAVY
jgi:hypothetical protein